MVEYTFRELCNITIINFKAFSSPPKETPCSLELLILTALGNQ